MTAEPPLSVLRGFPSPKRRRQNALRRPSKLSRRVVSLSPFWAPRAFPRSLRSASPTPHAGRQGSGHRLPSLLSLPCLGTSVGLGRPGRKTRARFPRSAVRFFAYRCRWILTTAGAGLPSRFLRRHFSTGKASPDSGQRRTAPNRANGGPRSSNSSGTLRRRLTPSAPARSASLRPRDPSCSPGGGAVDVYFPSWCFFTIAFIRNGLLDVG